MRLHSLRISAVNSSDPSNGNSVNTVTLLALGDTSLKVWTTQDTPDLYEAFSRGRRFLESNVERPIWRSTILIQGVKRSTGASNLSSNSCLEISRCELTATRLSCMARLAVMN